MSHDVTTLVEPPLPSLLKPKSGALRGLAYLFLRRESRRSTATFTVVGMNGNMAPIRVGLFRNHGIHEARNELLQQDDAMRTYSLLFFDLKAILYS
ncbi:hypothetical protein N782_18680 [Pontibacillus yanchengensis Y32]|uniref:Uncharacterized protein n=1 Tax=Pontibacillus yanchengensis Y32 TaxID=1385514 RepID=A0A0A2THW9_9BACI|nr:hypothetical protein N782_18680 [Pontibacillus yanchengensis Y32]